MHINRPFSSGSRLPPDPIDHHLMKEGYYRKHTARDTSSLFRVISEQMFHTQNYHEFVREEIVKYIARNRDLAMHFIDRDIDLHLAEMAKSRTHGTILELKASAYMFRRNVLLFQGLNKGTWLIDEPHFNEFFIVYQAEHNHFDTIFEQHYIEDAAFCQAMCYELLYTHVFRLPDVEYAVERMLHDPDGPPLSGQVYYSDELYNPYPETFVLEDGRAFRLDRPEHTACVLEDYRMCNFHNKHFESFYADLQAKLYSSPDGHAEEKARRTLQSLLTEPHMSCVRQLLNGGITPFPYKVAKALDRNIYRNIEFDSWSENRRERRIRMIGHNLHMGSKCLVRVHSAQFPYTCYIQDIRRNIGKCTVFIEELAEKRQVSFAALSGFNLLYTTTARQHYTRANRRIESPHHNALLPIRAMANKKTIGDSETHTNIHRSSNKLQYEYTKQTKNAPIDDVAACKAMNTMSKMRQSDSDYRRNFDTHDFIEMYDNNHGQKSTGGLYSRSPDMTLMSQLTSPSNFRPNYYEVVAAPLILGPNNNNFRSSQPKMTGSGSGGGHNVNKNTGGQNHIQSKAGPMAKGKSMGGNGCKGTPENNGKSANAIDHARANLSDSFTDLGNHNSGFQHDDSGYTNHPPRQMQQQPSQPYVYYYCDNPWSEPATVDPNYDPNRGSFNGPPRSDRLRNFYDGSAGTGYAPHGSFPDFMEPPGGNQPPLEPGQGFYPYFGNNAVIPVRRRDLLEQMLSVNLEAPPSYDPRGYDIATNDLGTLRFFYNMGHEFFAQLRMRYGMPAVAQLAHSNDQLVPLDQENGQSYHEGSGGYMSNHHGVADNGSHKVDNLSQKVNNIKLGGGKPNTSNNNQPIKTETFNRRNGGGPGKIAYNKRYSSNRNSASNDDLANKSEPDTKANISEALKCTPTTAHPRKDNIDRLESTGHQPYEMSQPPHRYTGVTEHPPPLLRTPVPLDSAGHAPMMNEMQPVAPFVPVQPGPPFHPYMAYYPFEEQPMLLPCPPFPAGGLQQYTTYSGPAPMHSQGHIPGNTIFYASPPAQSVAMAPQGYWYPPPNIVPLSPSQVPVASPCVEIPRSPSIKINHPDQPSTE